MRGCPPVSKSPPTYGGLSGGSDLETIINKTKISLKKGDITKQTTDAIVNAANSSLMGGGGVDGAIHHAGGPDILDQCKSIIEKIGRLPTGQAAITSGGDMQAKYVIHTIGPIWDGGKNDEPRLLASAYRESLKGALEINIKTVSFPSISTGIYGYPVKQAAMVALKTVIDFVKTNDSLEEIVFVLFDNSTYDAYAQALKSLTQQ
jgi:O-acetyl-ADP-ribose deacetylase (regulator of RNase III)